MSELHLHLSGTELNALVPELSFEGASEAGEPVDLRLADVDLADVRWLWEDSMVDLYEPGSGRRLRAEQASGRVGEALGRAFAAGEPMRRLLDHALRPGSGSVVLVSSGLDAALALPWELARTPSGGSLYSVVEGLARLRLNVSAPMVAARETAGSLRVLLVVSRPDAEEDVEYQAVAARLLERLDGRAEVRLVRPGTFPALERELGRGRWDLVHYDGHGTAGMLAFEDGPVEAERLGQVLAGAEVPLFALNACQSAVVGGSPAGEEREVGSVAQALVRTGAAGVVAMGATVRVVSAVSFFDRFYEELAGGATLARAAHRARRAIEAGRGHGPLDWAIPVLYLRQDVAPFPTRAPASAPSLDDLLFGGGEEAGPEGGAGGIFIGRDGDLYRVDRAVDEAPRVLLYGLGGIGKTTLMEHLLGWRSRTGGADRVLHFTFRNAPSLESLAHALETEAAVSRPEALPRFQGPQWKATPLLDRLRGLGRVLAADESLGRLLLFDNLETLGGYPVEGEGPYEADDRACFRALLAALQSRRVRVVMTSRREEWKLLGDGVRRLRLAGVKGHYRLPMLRAYAQSFDSERRLRDALADPGQQSVLGELLRVLGGHPLATRVAAYGLRDRPVADVLSAIRGKAAQIEVPAAERGTRSESLEAVFAGALEHLPSERRRGLGMLGLFGGQLHESDFLGLVTHERFPEEVLADRSEGATRQVLDEARQLGLIAPLGGADKVWEVAPGAQASLDRLWREALTPEVARAVELHYLRYWAATARLYSSALHSEGRAEWGAHYGQIDEGNLRKALDLAERERDWTAAHAILRLLLDLWPMQGRAKDARHLLMAWSTQVTGLRTGAWQGAGDDALRLWSFLLSKRANFYLRAGELGLASALYRQIIEVLESEADPAGDMLAVTYHELGMVEQGRGDMNAAEDWYRKSLEVAETLGNRRGMAASYHHLGMVELVRGKLDEAEVWCRKSLDIYRSLGDQPNLAYGYHHLGIIEMERGDLDTAEVWYRRSLKIKESLGDRFGVASSNFQLGMVEQERGNLDAAENAYRVSLKMMEAIGDRPNTARVFGQLGLLYAERGQPGAALRYMIQAFAMFVQVDPPAAQIAASTLHGLFRELGRESFERAWREMSAPRDLLDGLLQVFAQAEAGAEAEPAPGTDPPRE